MTDSPGSPRPADLPDFERPPVSEVALGIQFGALQNFHSYHSGLLWSILRDAFPTVQEHAQLPPMFETFGPSNALMPLPFQMLFQLQQQYPLPRYWFLSDDQTHLLQFQQDRIVYNWRKLKPEDTYPRYELLREHLESALTKIEAFLADNNLGRILSNQCEVSYINQIEHDEIDPRTNLERIFTVWSGQYSDTFLPQIEDGQLQFRFVLRNSEGQPDGRLYIQINPSVRAADQKPIANLTITARGIPSDQTIATAFAWLDRGRDAIVRAFASVTTAEMHRQWGRIARAE